MRTREEVSSRGEMNARRDERTNAPRTVPHRAKPHAAGSSAPSPLGSVNKNTRPQNASVGYIVRSSVKCESNTTVSAVAAPAGDASPAWVKRSVSRTCYRSNVEREARVKSDDGKVLKERRAPRERGRTGSSLACAAASCAAAAVVPSLRLPHARA